MEQLNCDEDSEDDDKFEDSRTSLNSNEDSEESSDSEEEEFHDVQEDIEESTPVDDLSLQGSLPISKNDPDTNDLDVGDILVKVDGELTADDEDSGESGEESDDEGWITPSNVKQAKIDMNHMDYEEGHAKVACITTDFAMQVCK